MWSLSNVSGCGSTSLFDSREGTHQIRDQSRALEDRNDSNNSLEVYTPNSFIHLFYYIHVHGCSRYAQYTDYPKCFCPLDEDSGSLLTCRILPLSVGSDISDRYPCLGCGLGIGNL